MSRDKMLNDIHPSDVPFNPFHTYRAEVQQSSFSENSCFDFEESGLHFLTNSKISENRKRSKRQASNTEISATNYNPVVSDFTYYDGTIRTRTHFPETWLWNELLATDFTTVFSKNVPIVPDTITSWYVTALSLNRHSGLAVTQAPSILTVFRPFFITLNLPYAVTRGEQFELQVLVHNYLNQSVEAKITFFNDAEKFRFIDTRQVVQQNVIRVLGIEKATVANVSFAIMPLVAGEIPLRLQAVADVAGDAIIRNLRVEVPGIKVWNQVTTQAYDGSSDSDFKKYTIQRKRTKRNTQHKLTLVGTPFEVQSGISDNHTRVGEGMLKLPEGCGEQSMSKHYPNVLALDWLKANQREDEGLKHRAKRNLETGYQLQMTFFNHDLGSFRYYDEYRLDYDYTWLTAYVLRCFLQTRRYITVDDAVLLKGLRFLVRQQHPKTGAFIGDGTPMYRVRNSNSSTYGLTAFVTLAIIEITHAISSDITRSERIRFNDAKFKGLNFISSDSSLIDSDPYNLILVTATLAAANHNSSKRFFEKMDGVASMSADRELKWWQMPSGRENSAMTVEMTAYALLAHLWMSKSGAVGNSLPIVRWVLKQKTEGGGFHTTQDTVAAFTALSKFAEMTISSSADDAVTVEVSNKNGEIMGQVVINSTNRDAAHEFPLPKYLDGGEFSVLLKGKGKAFMHYTEEHYTEKIVNKTHYYEISGNLTKDEEADKQDVHNLEFCLKLKDASVNASGQVVAQIKLPTGFSFEDEAAELVTPLARRTKDTVEKIELKESKTWAVIYYAHLNFPKQCLIMPVLNYIKATSRFKGTIRVSDYYNPDQSDLSVIYPDEIYTVCHLCLETGACDVILGCRAD